MSRTLKTSVGLVAAACLTLASALTVHARTPAVVILSESEGPLYLPLYFSSIPTNARHPERSAAKPKDPEELHPTPAARTFQPPKPSFNLTPPPSSVILSEREGPLYLPSSPPPKLHPPAQSPDQTPAPATPPITDGPTLFTLRGCAQCHQIHGTGGHKGPDLSGVGRRLKPEAIHTQIVHGSDAMPAFGEALPPEEIDALTRYLHTLRAKTPKPLPTPAPASPPAPAPSPEG